jgi:hypothetical protein
VARQLATGGAAARVSKLPQTPTLIVPSKYLNLGSRRIGFYYISMINMEFQYFRV